MHDLSRSSSLVVQASEIRSDTRALPGRSGLQTSKCGPRFRTVAKRQANDELPADRVERRGVKAGRPGGHSCHASCRRLMARLADSVTDRWWAGPGWVRVRPCEWMMHRGTDTARASDLPVHARGSQWSPDATEPGITGQWITSTVRGASSLVCRVENSSPGPHSPRAPST